MIDVGVVIRARADSWAVAEEHEPADFPDLLARLGIENGEWITVVPERHAAQLLDDQPSVREVPRAAAAMGVRSGFATGVRVQRTLEGEPVPTAPEAVTFADAMADLANRGRSAHRKSTGPHRGSIAGRGTQTWR